MAMDKDTLGTLIKTKVDALSDTEKQTDIKVWSAVADAIISHIKSNAEIGALTQSGITISPGAVITQGTTVQSTGKIS
jgi:hypothetical protein